MNRRSLFKKMVGISVGMSVPAVIITPESEPNGFELFPLMQQVICPDCKWSAFTEWKDLTKDILNVRCTNQRCVRFGKEYELTLMQARAKEV